MYISMYICIYTWIYIYIYYMYLNYADMHIDEIGFPFPGDIKSNIDRNGSKTLRSPQGIVCIKFKASSEAEECIRAPAPRAGAGFHVKKKGTGDESVDFSNCCFLFWRFFLKVDYVL